MAYLPHILDDIRWFLRWFWQESKDWLSSSVRRVDYPKFWLPVFAVLALAAFFRRDEVFFWFAIAGFAVAWFAKLWQQGDWRRLRRQSAKERAQSSSTRGPKERPAAPSSPPPTASPTTPGTTESDK